MFSTESNSFNKLSFTSSIFSSSSTNTRMLLAKSFSITFLLTPSINNATSLSILQTRPKPNFPFNSFRFLHCNNKPTNPLKPQTPNCQNPIPNTTPHTSSDTHQAISQFLRESGLPSRNADLIAANCPNYAKMLVDSVRDLEEWNSLSGGSEFGELGFKEKVVYMAKEKGDCGKVAFFESIGLSLNSAMNVARYLSGESLLILFHKVKYMKEIFFYGSEDNGVIGKNARRMLMHLSIPVNEDLQRTLSLFEKIEARQGGLQSLNSLDSSFRYLIESFPRILSLPVDSHFEPLVELLESIGVSRGHMRSIFLLFPPMIFYGVKGIKRKVWALEKAGAIGKDCGNILIKYPWILSAEILDNYTKILSFFETELVEKECIDKAVRSCPHILGCSTLRLKVMVDQFSEIGVRNKELGRVISKSPQLLLKKPQEFLQVVSYLETLGFDRESVGKLLTRCPEAFATSVQKTLKKKVEFLNSIGITEAYLPRVIKKYPELLVSNVDKTLLPRLKYLRMIGLSKGEIAFMVRRFSPLLGYSIDHVLRPKHEFLVNTMQKPVKDVVDYPRYFSYSLEKKIKPRYWVLKGMDADYSLKDMLDKNDDEFAADFMDARGFLASGSPPDR